MNSQRGFTLIELMIAMAVLAIIASIAVPGYRSHMLRTQRTEGIAELLRIRNAEEKFFLQNNAYTAGFGPVGLNLQAVDSTTLISQSGRYRFTVEVPDPAASAAVSFRITATAQNSQAADSNCAALTLDDRGMRGASPGSVGECWK